MVALAGLFVRQTQNQHVFGHPAVAARHGGGDTQREALLAQQGVAAVTRTVGPNLVGLGEVGDVLRFVARPVRVLLARLERRTHGVNCRNPRLARVNQVHRLGAHARHDAHVQHHVSGVGQLDTQLGNRAAQRTHRERHHVHGATLHRTLEHTIFTD